MKHLSLAVSILGAVATATAADPVSHLARCATNHPAAAAAGRMARDVRGRTYVAPARVMWTEGAERTDRLVEDPRGQVFVQNPGVCRLTRKDGAPAAVLVDFGLELHGAFQILVGNTPGNKPARIRVRLGESAAEAMSDIGGPKNATNDHAIRDDTMLVPWLGTREFGPSGFRFARIDLLDDGALDLVGLRAILLVRDLEYLGSFRCSDERLNRIWITAAWTAHLNLQDYLWDGIKRDRLVWIGDMHPETMALATVFGRAPAIEASLDLVRDATPLPQWMNGISSYSMWWILIHRDWYRFHGDLDYLRDQKAYLVPLLDRLLSKIGPDGAERLDGMRFLDWPTAGNKPAVHAGLQALLAMTLDAGAEICTTLGDADAAGRAAAGAKRLRANVPDAGGSKQAAALLSLAGFGDPAAYNRDVLAVGGAKDMSTFYGYYMLEARAKAGDVQGGLDAIRTYWGAMLDRGATSFWEDFNLDWLPGASRIDELPAADEKDLHGDFGAHCYKGFRHSLCHGWASGPAPWLTRHVLGVEGVEPGAKTVRVAPVLGDLAWAEGTFPTPAGVLKVRHDKRPDGTVESKIDAPPGVKIVGPAARK